MEVGYVSQERYDTKTRRRHSQLYVAAGEPLQQVHATTRLQVAVDFLDAHATYQLHQQAQPADRETARGVAVT